MICSVEKCVNNTYSRGFCRKHYQRWLRYGDPMILRKNSTLSKDNIDKVEFEKIIGLSDSYAQVLRSLNLQPSGGNYKQLKMRIEEIGIDTNHFEGKNHGRSRPRRADPRDVLIKNSKSSNGVVRKILLNNLNWSYECAICCIQNTWQNKKLTLHLDHIDGDNRNNEIGNLRFLCPNCHSQTSTYCIGKRNKTTP